MKFKNLEKMLDRPCVVDAKFQSTLAHYKRKYTDRYQTQQAFTLGVILIIQKIGCMSL
jgi:hypothetical protein